MCKNRNNINTIIQNMDMTINIAIQYEYWCRLDMDIDTDVNIQGIWSYRRGGHWEIMSPLFKDRIESTPFQIFKLGWLFLSQPVLRGPNWATRGSDWNDPKKADELFRSLAKCLTLRWRNMIGWFHAFGWVCFNFLIWQEGKKFESSLNHERNLVEPLFVLEGNHKAVIFMIWRRIWRSSGVLPGSKGRNNLHPTGRSRWSCLHHFAIPSIRLSST